MATDGMGGTDEPAAVTPIPPISRPTAQLRFVERHINNAGTIRPVRILQQMWQITSFDSRGRDPHLSYEWRDVPLELEG